MALYGATRRFHARCRAVRRRAAAAPDSAESEIQSDHVMSGIRHLIGGISSAGLITQCRLYDPRAF